MQCLGCVRIRSVRRRRFLEIIETEDLSTAYWISAGRNNCNTKPVVCPILGYNNDTPGSWDMKVPGCCRHNDYIVLCTS